MKHFLLFSLCLSFSFQVFSQIIFPGDLNNDGVANNLDILAAGVAYGATGPERLNASFDWIPQKSTPWGIGLPVSGVDLSFCDANGDGLVDSLDIEAIVVNYDSLQTTAVPPPTPYVLPDTFPVEERPQVQVRFEPDSVLEGSTVSVVIDYIHPPQLPPSAAALGLAFALEYEESLVQDSLITFSPAADAQDLMMVAAAADFKDFWRSVGPGRVEIAAAGRGLPALDRSRELGRVEIVIEDMVFFPQPEPFERLILTVEDFLLINPAEEVIDLVVKGDTLVIYSPVNGLPSIAETPPSLQLSPNPARQLVKVQVDRALAEAIRILDAQGRTVYQEKTGPANVFAVELKDLSRGLYFVEILTDRGRLSQRLVIP